MTDTGFSHITVTPADEEDEVIEAGLSVNQTTGTVQMEEAPDPEPAPAQEEKPPAAVRPAAPEKGARKAAASEYHETTLEDLQAQSMPFAQKVVIIAAVICIIGAIVYCIAFMG